MRHVGVPTDRSSERRARRMETLGRHDLARFAREVAARYHKIHDGKGTRDRREDWARMTAPVTRVIRG